jgi:Zn-dependent peptidase ImmA (M78 family)
MAERFNLTAFPVDVEQIAKDLGAMVIHQAADAEVSGMLLRRDGQTAIGINPQQPRTGQRFALAHLIGHLQIHRSRDLILDTSARYNYGNLASLPTDREEAEANRFAAALLAPEGAVRRIAAETAFRTSSELTQILADHFEMSRAAMGYWLMTLGVVMDI